MLISVVIPVYNDRAKIGDTLETLVNFFNTKNISTEIIVVHDCGHDNTVEVVKEKMKKYPSIQLIDRGVNMGKGYTIREGLQKANGDFVFYTDADLPYLTEPILEMLTLLKSGKADLVLANRDLSTARGEKKPGWPRQITHVIYSLLVRFLIPIPFSDTLAGLKGMRADVARAIAPRLTIDRFSFDVELLLIAKKAGFKIKEMPVSLKNVGKSNLKIGKDAPQMFGDVVRIWLNYKKGRYE